MKKIIYIFLLVLLCDCTTYKKNSSIYHYSSLDSSYELDTLIMNVFQIKDNEKMKDLLQTIDQKYFDYFKDVPNYYEFRYNKKKELYVSSYRCFHSDYVRKYYSKHYVVSQVNGKIFFLSKDNYDENIFSIDSSKFDTVVFEQFIEEFSIIRFDSLYNYFEKDDNYIPCL